MATIITKLVLLKVKFKRIRNVISKQLSHRQRRKHTNNVLLNHTAVLKRIKAVVAVSSAPIKASLKYCKNIKNAF